MKVPITAVVTDPVISLGSCWMSTSSIDTRHKQCLNPAIKIHLRSIQNEPYVVPLSQRFRDASAKTPCNAICLLRSCLICRTAEFRQNFRCDLVSKERY